MIIKIKNLRLKTIIGVYEWEQSIAREIIINIEIETDHRVSMQSDNIEDALDYDIIVAKIKKFIGANHFKLVERMVLKVIDLIMEDKRIKKCQLEIDKVGAIDDIDSFSVTQIRERK